MNINQIQRQSLMVFGSTIAMTLGGFLSTVYFAHVLGPAPLGAYFLFMAYYGVFSLIGDGGFGGAAVKRISEGKERNEYFSAFVFIRVILLAISITALLCAEPYLNDITSSGIFFWLMLALIVSVFPGSASYGVYGTGKVGIHQVSTVIEWLFRLFLQVAFVYIGYSAAGLAGGFVGGMIAGGIANLGYLELRLVRFRVSHIKNLSLFSFWIFLTMSGLLIFSYTDTILIGFFMSTTDIGIYRTALQLASVGSFTTIALQTVLYPKMSSWAAQGRVTDIENAISRACTYSLFLAIPTCIGGWILGDQLLYYLYGASFTEGTVPLFFLLLVQIVNIFMFLGTTSLNALDRPKDAFWISLFASITNVVLLVIFIPVMGITGAAIATLIAMIINSIVAYVLLSRIISVKIEYKAVKNILWATIVMGIFLLFVRILLPISNVLVVLALVTTGAIIYTIVIFKLDQGIHDEIREICTNLGIKWPNWL